MSLAEHIWREAAVLVREPTGRGEDRQVLLEGTLREIVLAHAALPRGDREASSIHLPDRHAAPTSFSPVAAAALLPELLALDKRTNDDERTRELIWHDDRQRRVRRL